MEVEISMSRRTISVLTAPAIVALMLVACGGEESGGGDDGADNPTTAAVTSESSPAPQPLAQGRYRLTIQEDCDDYTVSITQEGGEFTYEISNSPIRIVFVNDVPSGSFLIEQTNPDCTEWELDLARVSGG